MGSWKYAFSLPNEDVKDATPAGTVRLVGMPPFPSYEVQNAPGVANGGKGVP